MASHDVSVARVAELGERLRHNVARAVQLLQGSYRELTSTNVPGATLR